MMIMMMIDADDVDDEDGDDDNDNDDDEKEDEDEDDEMMPTPVLRQPAIATHEARSRMNGGVCLGNKALATRSACLTFLLDNAFLARLLIFFLITCPSFRLTPRAIPAFNP